jgi:tetratricopeptide (TPR) repeat protein
MNLYALIAFSLLSFQFAAAQNLEETIQYADAQLKAGNNSSALKAYQRAVFFSDGQNNLYLYTQVADISFSNGDYENAQKYYGFAYNQSENDSLKTELLFDKAYCQILNKNYQFAIIDLLSIADTSTLVEKRLNFYLGTCYFGLEEFSKAESSFLLCVDQNEKSELTALFSERHFRKPSPKAARIMSTIIPGLGQTYSGDLKSGFNSLLLTSGLVVLGITIAITYHPIDAIVAILPWYQRYYTGGYNNAEKIAMQKRAARRAEIYRNILTLAG